MAAEGFFKRWSRLKSAGAAQPPAAHEPEREPARAPEPVRPPSGPAPESQSQPLPTLGDAARLNADSDYSAFMARDVDKAVRRMALKKLFSDPHFNRMDGLDIYIGDYTKPSPLPAAMLASLKHAENIFGPKPEETDNMPSATGAAADAPQSIASASGEDPGEGQAGQASDAPRTPEPPASCPGHPGDRTPSTRGIP